MFSSTVRDTLVLAAILWLAAPARAVTPLTGTFDDAQTYLDNWVNVGSGETWSPDDADGSPSSGSLEITNTLAPNFTEFPYICVLANAGTDYVYGAKLKTPSSQAATAESAVAVAWESDFSCLVDIGFTATTDQSGAFDVWTPVQGEAIAPPNTVAARILLRVKKLTGNAGVPFVVRYDDVTLPEPGATAESAAALIVLGCCRRRHGAVRS